MSTLDYPGKSTERGGPGCQVRGCHPAEPPYSNDISLHPGQCCLPCSLSTQSQPWSRAAGPRALPAPHTARPASPGCRVRQEAEPGCWCCVHQGDAAGASPGAQVPMLGGGCLPCPGSTAGQPRLAWRVPGWHHSPGPLPHNPAWCQLCWSPPALLQGCFLHTPPGSKGRPQTQSITHLVD